MLESHFSYDKEIVKLLKKNGFVFFKQKSVTLKTGDFGMIRALRTEWRVNMKTATTTIKNIYGQIITVFDDDYIGQKVIAKGIYEKQLISYAEKILEAMDQPVVFDIGANIGNHSLAFSRKAKLVYAFEPVPQIYDVLSQNVNQNQLDNVRCMNMALSNVNAEDDIFLFQDNLGGTSFDEHEKHDCPIRVSKRIGDEVVAEQDVVGVDFMKIDTEGHEAYVLQGLAKTIKKYQPYIIVEWNDPLTIKRFQEANILENIFTEYQGFVLGSNFDSGYWLGKSFAKFKRRLTRSFCRKQVRLYHFDPRQAYKNILLVPNSKQQFLPR